MASVSVESKMLCSDSAADVAQRWSHLSDHAINLILSIVAVFAPLKTVMLALLFLVSTDLVTGLYAAVVTKATFTSRRLARTIVKTFVYLTTICVVHVANKYLLSAGDFTLPLDTLIVSFIALTELKSILENLQKIQKQPLLQFIIDRIASDSSQALDRIQPNKKVTPIKGKRRGTTKRQK